MAPETVTLAPGDLLLIYSDGIPESVRRTTGETFGFERLRNLVALGGAAKEAHDRVVGAFDAFLSGEPQSDDISLVALSRVGAADGLPGEAPAALRRHRHRHRRADHRPAAREAQALLAPRPRGLPRRVGIRSSVALPRRGRPRR